MRGWLRPRRTDGTSHRSRRLRARGSLAGESTRARSGDGPRSDDRPQHAVDHREPHRNVELEQGSSGERREVDHTEHDRVGHRADVVLECELLDSHQFEVDQSPQGVGQHASQRRARRLGGDLEAPHLLGPSCPGCGSRMWSTRSSRLRWVGGASVVIAESDCGSFGDACRPLPAELKRAVAPSVR